MQTKLRSWRERAQTPLKSPGETIPTESDSDKLTNRTNPDSLRVGLSETAIGQTAMVSDKPQSREGSTPLNVRSSVRSDRNRLVRTGPNTWVLAEWSLSLCVMCDEQLAPGDRIACVEHRARIDAAVIEAVS